MADVVSIKVAEFNGDSWVKIKGRGDVFLTPTLKSFTEKVLERERTKEEGAAHPSFIIDMKECTGMDSTFMGALAGLAIKLQGMASSALVLCRTSPKNMESLEELGIHALMEVNPAQLEHYEDNQDLVSAFMEWTPDSELKPDQGLILDTHKTLWGLNKENEKEFSSLIESLEKKANKKE